MAPTACWIGLIQSFLICSLPNSKTSPSSYPTFSLYSLFISGYLPEYTDFIKNMLFLLPGLTFSIPMFEKLPPIFQDPITSPDAFCAEVEAGALGECSMADLLCLVTTVAPQVHGEPPSPRGTWGLNWVHLQNGDNNNACITSFVLFWSWNHSLWPLKSRAVCTKIRGW